MKSKVLIVCNWPLGGIRTFLKYNYAFMPRNDFQATLLAAEAIEKGSLVTEMNDLGIDVVFTGHHGQQNSNLAIHAAKILSHRKFDLIHSQGFISAIHTSVSNWLFRVPHIMTIHGILEEKYFHGRLGPLKRAIFANAMKNVDVFHGVSTDILDHFIKAYPRAKARGSRCVVITNGIMTAPFAEPSPNAGRDLRELLKVEKDTFIFGFFGRYMPQKGFNYVIDAVECLKNADDRGKFVIMPVGSGDYEPHYRGQIEKRGLEPYFKFIPYKPDISWMMKGCDTVLMPSIWEAWGLLACEVLCAGVPLIATNCIGLREAVANTPAVVIPPHDHISLARAMQNVMHNPGLKAEFEDFRTEAAIRFDVRRSAEKLFALFAEICGRHAAAVPQPLLTPRE